MAKKSKNDIFKMQLIDVIDEFLIALEIANRAQKKLHPLEDAIPMTFESFIKWLLYKRNKKLIEKHESGNTK